MRNLFICGGAAAALALAAPAFGADRLIAVDSSRALYEIDMTTGAKTQIGTVSSNASTTGGLAYDRATQTMWVSGTLNDNLYTLDISTGNATLVGNYGDPAVVMHGIEFDNSTGRLFGGSNGNLLEINKTTGQATVIGSTGLATGSFINLGYNSDTDTMYATHTGTDSLYRIDRATAAVTLLGPMTGTSNPHGLAYDFNNDRMFLIDSATDTLYTLDLTTGAANVVGSTGAGNLLGLAFVPEIPEPSTLALAGVGLASLLTRRRK